MFIIFCIVFVLIAQHASAATYECACQCPYGSNSSLAFTSENSAEACVSACIASPFNPCASVNTYACLGTDCAYSSSYDNSTTFTVRSLFRCSCQCPYGSVQGSVYTSGNSSEACIRACIASPFNPCVASNTYACSGTDCTYSSSYDNSTEATTTTRNIVTSLFRCSCQCPYGSIQTPVYTSDNSPEACVRACIASPFNPCISSNTYACLGTDCMYSSSYDSPIVTNTIVQRFQCSCQCPYGSTPSFAYTSENSSQACIRACIASPSNPCIPWNTYACLGTDCAYANWYIHSRRILAVHRPCACQCPSGSSRTSAFAIGDSSQNCAIACNSTLEINAMEDNTTIDSIIDEFDSVYNINYIDTKRNETSITAGGVTFGADEGSEAVDPRDVAVLASYRRAIDRHMYTDEARFEQVQIRARHHLLRTLGCKVADIEKILQWSWIPRDNCGFRLAGHPLKVPRPPNGKVYSMVHGISFYENGSFFLNLTEADEGTALFNSDDVELIMKRGITGASFSLDPPLGSDLPHPFQKATWAPYDALNGTDFLATMLHADLWLKSMGFLVEASARSPFRIRSIRDGVYNSLPQDLYQRLFKQGRLERDKLFSSTRMWIESGTMKYNVLEQDDNVMYVFGSPNMQIKYENLIQRVKNHTTGLTDTVTGSNSSWHEHFAATATENYIELGHSFPELLRLAELSKLTAIALVFQHRYRELRKIVLPPTTESVAQVLTTSNLRGQVFNGRWPLATYARVEELLDKALVEQGINLAHKYWVRNLDQSRALIRQQLTELENKQITEITQALEKAFNISSNRISRTAISSYLSGTGSAAEYALLQEIVSGIAERIRSSQSGAIRLYETMSQSGYSVGDLSSVLPEFAQISLGKGPIKNFEDMESSSCYYVPTQISLVYQGNGSFLQQRGGVKLQPRFQYQKDPIFGFPQYRPLRPMVFTDIVTPSPITRNRDILFDRVSFKDSKTKETWYGPKYSGTTRLSDYNGWDRLIQQQKASIDDKKIISGMSINEGKIEAVQSYDSQVVSAGAMQKTINEKGTGEFPIQVWNFKNKHPQLYEELFKAQGWEVKKQSGAYSMTYNQETGNDLKTSIREDFQEKIKKTSSKPLQVLVNAISTPEFQELQVTEFVDRLNKQVLPMKPKGYDSYTISDYLQSHLGRAVALDQHVNAPSNVKVDFGKALNHLFKEHPKLSKNPADWGENRQKYETELIEYYGEHRRMHDPIGRFKKLKDAFE